MLFVVCFCGCPGSGKSTAALSLIEMIKDDARFARSYYISSDEVEASLMTPNSAFDHNVWKSSRRAMLTRLVSLRSLHQCDPRPALAILDDTFHYKSMRKNVRPDIIFYMNTNLQDCLDRNAKRPKPIPAFIVEKCHSIFEAPPAQNSWESKVPCYEGFPVPDVVDLIFNITQKPQSVSSETIDMIKETSVTISMKHNLDIELRRIIASKLSPLNAIEKKRVFKRLNDERKRLIAEAHDACNIEAIVDEFTRICQEDQQTLSTL